MTDVYKIDLAKHGVWLAFERAGSGKVVAWGETAEELSKKCHASCKDIIRSNRSTRRGKYRFFETEEEALRYLEKGLNYSRAIVHEPTGNCWESIQEASKWLGVQVGGFSSAVYSGRLSNFKLRASNPGIKEPQLKIVLDGPRADRMRMTDAWPDMPNGKWEKLKDAPSGIERRAAFSKKDKDRKTWTWYESMTRTNLGIKVKVTNKDDFLKSRKVGEIGTLISRECGGFHPYKVIFSKGTVLYAKPDQIEVVG
jgi:hypothetical protein